MAHEKSTNVLRRSARDRRNSELPNCQKDGHGSQSGDDVKEEEREIDSIGTSLHPDAAVITTANVKVKDRQNAADHSAVAGSSIEPLKGGNPKETSSDHKGKRAKIDEEVEEPSKKRKGKSKAKHVDEDDKRATPFRPSPSNAVKDRIHRVQMQRMFLVHRSGTLLDDCGDESKSKEDQKMKPCSDLQETFKVAGSTGNVYTVTIGRKNSCDCPDSSVVCKHILFVFLKVLGVPSTSHLHYQAALTRRELREVFDKAKPDPTVSDPALSQAYLTSIGESVEVAASAKEAKMPDEGDTCPICYDDFKPSKREDLVFCDISCGKPLHRACSEQWSLCRRQANLPLSCVWCRAEVATPVFSEDGGRYLNLAGPARLPEQRDFSIYSQYEQSTVVLDFPDYCSVGRAFGDGDHVCQRTPKVRRRRNSPLSSLAQHSQCNTLFAHSALCIPRICEPFPSESQSTMNPSFASQDRVTHHPVRGDAKVFPKKEECAALDKLKRDGNGDGNDDDDDDIVFLHLNTKKRKPAPNLKVKMRRPSVEHGAGINGGRTTKSGRAVKNTQRYVSSFKQDQPQQLKTKEKILKTKQAPLRSVEDSNMSQVNVEVSSNTERSADHICQPSGVNEWDSGDIVVRVCGVHRSFQMATEKEIKAVITEFRQGHNELLKQAKIVELSYKRLEAMLTLAKTKNQL